MKAVGDMSPSRDHLLDLSLLLPVRVALAPFARVTKAGKKCRAGSHESITEGGAGVHALNTRMILFPFLDKFLPVELFIFGGVLQCKAEHF